MLDLSRRKVLYITYDGILEPLGQSQVLAYLERLAESNSIYLLSFEKATDLANKYEQQALLERMGAVGIVWHPLQYHKSPSVIATSWDIALGTAIGLWLTKRYQLTIVHARSYVPSVMALLIKQLAGSRFIFDMRGFWADERADGDLWAKGGIIYRTAKWFERRFLLGADHVVSLTHSAVRIIRGFDYLQGRMPAFTVIPTCADLRRFNPISAISRDRTFTIGYLGSVGTWYMFDKVAAAFAILLRLRPDAKLLIINRGAHDYIYQCLREAGVPTSATELVSASHSEVPALIARMHAGIFFYKPAFSMQATAPTKLGELLGCGIPCLSNTGVGDMAEVLESDRVGVAIKAFDEASLHEGLTQLLSLWADPEVSERCVDAARRYFSLDEGVVRYERIYTSFGA